MPKGETADEKIERLARKVRKNQQKLAKAVAEACPGNHYLAQHRDGNEPWCRHCHRTAYGRRIEKTKPDYVAQFERAERSAGFSPITVPTDLR